MIFDNNINNMPISCINRAAVEFHVPATLIVSVLSIERGTIGTISRNKNGTYDMGLMQINSSWLPTLRKYGYSANDIIYDACKNVYVGTWILANNISKSNELWKGVGNYHSHRASLNYSYAIKVKNIFFKLEDL
jgi:soluble lytic murein transglycosylase-like protein